MKKLLLFAAIAVFGMTSANAQDGFKLGINLGMPIGDAGDGSSLEVGIDAAYLWEISEDFKVGGTIGYGTFLAKEQKIMGQKIKGDDIGFLPIAATAQYSFTESIFAGADLGYALVLSPSELSGGFYYMPKVGYQTDMFEVYVGYKGFSVEADAPKIDLPDIPGVDFDTSGGSTSTTLSAIVVGFNYKF